MSFSEDNQIGRSMKRILIIEDDEDIVELVRYNLEKEGFQVFSEEDGLNGLTRA